MEYPGVQPHVHALAGVISSLFLFLFSFLLLSYAVALLSPGFTENALLWG